MIDKNTLEKYRIAGRIAAEARDYGASLVKPSVKLLEVAEKVEARIHQKGADIAFPVNISLNEIAAHYTPRNDDKQVFNKGDIVKLDVGAHIDGYIADTALTIEVETNNYTDMIKAADESLKIAIDMVKPDINLSELGKTVQETIKRFGFTPIDNLTGHSLQRYILHSDMSIPSVPDVLNNKRPKIGDVIAIEPFATDGRGHVISGQGSNIYLCEKTIRSKFTRDKRANIWYNRTYKKFGSLPFAQRWINNVFENNSDIILNRLSFLGMIKHYPQLVEQKKGIVTQKEHTVIITENGCEVTT
ncbi:MAG: type II methionyl aminopeptidase [Candidatus Thermoplasmatota archaeon]|nr:type II methionyl aminopeptidase [Candidatus Thermoplasmatota archaeon]